jgi:hypothetical protein
MFALPYCPVFLIPPEFTEHRSLFKPVFLEARYSEYLGVG